MEMNRRGFLAGGAAAITIASSAADGADGGFAEVSRPGVPERKHALLPAGAESFRKFDYRCTGCQLCVNVCPHHVLRAAKNSRRFPLPEMGFEEGFCRVSCSRCGEVCPAGAIRPVTLERKRHIHIGHAVWHSERCLCVTEGESCTACFKYCPVHAIHLVRLKKEDPQAKLVPVVDADRCIGCGACENLCPARPMPAMTVEGFAEHLEIEPMGKDEAVAEAMRLVDENLASVALIKHGEIIVHETGSGISPILDRLDRDAKVMHGSEVVDKIIGRAAAAICICGGVVTVHAKVMSEGAKKMLESRNVRVTASQVVPEIRNRAGTGICPMELAVAKLDDPEKMVKAIRRKLMELNRKQETAKK